MDYKMTTKVEFPNGQSMTYEKYLGGKPSKITLSLSTETQNAPTVVIVGTKEIVVP